MSCEAGGIEPGAPAELLREIVRQGEARLNAALNLATAADLRATTLCGIFGTSAVTLAAAVLAYLASGHTNSGLVLAGAIAGIDCFIAAMLAGVSARPRDFYVAGGLPDELRNWSWTGTTWRTASELLDATTQRYALSIRNNKTILESNSHFIKLSLLIGLAAPVVGALVYFADWTPLW